MTGPSRGRIKRVKLRTYVAILLGSVFVLFACASEVIKRAVLRPSFEKLERDAARDEGERAVAAVRRELEALEGTAIDLGMWDDAFEFIAKPDERFIKSNFASETYYIERNFSVVMYVDSAGVIKWANQCDSRTGQAREYRTFAGPRLALSHPVMSRLKEGEALSGLIDTEHGPIMVAARHVLRADGSGPSRGRIILARPLDTQMVQQICQRTGTSFTVWNQDTAEDEGVRTAAKELVYADAVLTSIDDARNTALNYRLLPMLIGKPLVLRTQSPMYISAQGNDVIEFAQVSQIAAAGLVVIVGIVLVHSRVSGPLARLATALKRVGETGDLTLQFRTTRQDEIGDVAAEFEKMLARLTESQDAVVQASRHAGMAEVAANVLHNVGNTLTNSIVLTSDIQSTLRTSRAAGLGKAIDMLKQHEGDLPRFIAEDAKGKQLPAYLIKAGDAIASEHASLVSDVEKLERSLAAVQDIIRAQQAVDGPTEVLQPVDLHDVVQGALAVIEPSFLRHRVRCTCSVPADIRTMLDRSKFQQVLLNLVTNGVQACKLASDKHRFVHIEAGILDAERVFIEVRDGGMGFDEERKAKLFTQGYTTREDGHGLGLHYCANAVKQMNGSITAQSDGPGLGATFRMELPLRFEGLADAPQNNQRMAA